jgi:hypothetical protein
VTEKKRTRQSGVARASQLKRSLKRAKETVDQTTTSELNRAASVCPILPYLKL